MSIRKLAGIAIGDGLTLLFPPSEMNVSSQFIFYVKFFIETF